nr:beta-ketoacyl-ACP synthase III [Herbihabitans rhizosphaerae]
MVSTLRQRRHVREAKIIGLGSYLPSTVVASDEVAARFGRDEEWVLARTGIATRRRAEKETVSQLAVKAATRALARCALTGGDMDLVIVASCSVEQPMPDVASGVARALGAEEAGAFDLNAACAGFCYALAVAADAVRMGSARHVLVIGAEKMTAWVDPEDLGTSIIFGDGAGAAVVGPAEEPGIGPVAWGSDGTRAELIEVPDGKRTMNMDGRAVFRWATTEIYPVAQRACDLAGVAPADLDALVPHQANLRIVNALATKIGATNAVIADDVIRYGNTSAASIPIALDTLITEGTVEHNGTALLFGFGAGLCYAAQVVTLPTA